MSEDLRIDSHKLIFHPTRVSEWLQGKNIYPIYIEISPSGACNHRCVFCAKDYLEYKPLFLDQNLLLDNLRLMAQKGVKSVMYAGEGEPFLNKNMPDIINQTKYMGIDVALSTNGVLLTKDLAGYCLGSLTWIRFSVNAGTPQGHQNVHRSKAGDFEKIISNIADAVNEKRKSGLKTTIGVQMLMIPENFNEVPILGKILQQAGVDYFTVKPFSKHPKSYCDIDQDFDYKQHLELERELNSLETESFRIIFRAHTMNKLSQKKRYSRCLGLPFYTYIDASAGVWACCTYVGDQEYCYGNLKEDSFVQIWEGDRHARILELVAKELNVDECRDVCRLDEINAYLHQLRHPGDHVNFI